MGSICGEAFSPCFGRTNGRLCYHIYFWLWFCMLWITEAPSRTFSKPFFLGRICRKRSWKQCDCFGKVIPSITLTDLCTLPPRLYLVLLLFHVVSIEMCKGVFHQCSKDKHVADPEVNVQCLDGRGSWEGGSGTDHQCGHCKNSGDTCRAAWERNTCTNIHKYIY